MKTNNGVGSGEDCVRTLAFKTWLRWEAMQMYWTVMCYDSWFKKIIQAAGGE